MLDAKYDISYFSLPRIIILNQETNNLRDHDSDQRYNHIVITNLLIPIVSKGDIHHIVLLFTDTISHT